MDYSLVMITIVELPEFIKQAKKIFSVPLRESLINYLAAHPKAGVIMEGAGGIRKIRCKEKAQVKVEVVELYTITIMTSIRYSC